MNRQIFAAIFDLDGLMADSEPLAKWAWQQTLARYGEELDDQTFRQVQGMRIVESSHIFCERFSLPISPQQAMAERDELFLQAVPAHLRARPGLYPLLDDLDARGLLLGVATSGHRRYVSLALRTLGLDGRFRAVAAGDEVEHGKPAPDVYLLAAERAGVSPEHCLALEDAPLGVEAAVAAGMTCLAVPSQWTATLDFPGAARVFASLDEVREALDGLLGSRYLVRYVAAGGVVTHEGRVLVLRRPGRDEVRLPKGHIDPGETAQETALREVCEESGYADLALQADLGTQVVEFDYKEQHVIRSERYFLIELADGSSPPGAGEEQFEPAWLTWEEAQAELTFESEREWVRRGRLAANQNIDNDNREEK